MTKPDIPSYLALLPSISVYLRSFFGSLAQANLFSISVTCPPCRAQAQAKEFLQAKDRRALPAREQKASPCSWSPTRHQSLPLLSPVCHSLTLKYFAESKFIFLDRAAALMPSSWQFSLCQESCSHSTCLEQL